MLCCFMMGIYAIKAQQTPMCGNWGSVYLESVSSFEEFEYGNWELVFEDNFDDMINTSKWFTCFDGWNRRHGDELQYYLDNNISIENGVLKLQAKREPDFYPIVYFDSFGIAHHSVEYFEYTSGMLQTKSKFQYGLFEIRCKIPSGQGLWPAFWLFGNGGEIDIFEFNSLYPDKHYMTIHTWPYDGNGVHEYCATNWNSNSLFSDDFHTFSLEWDEYKLIFRVDGIVKRIDYKYSNILGHGLYDCFHQTSGIYIENPMYPEHAQFLIINLAIANDNNGTFGPAPNAQTLFPSALEIDYVKVYKKTNPQKNLSICGFNEMDSDYCTGKTISIAGSGSCLTVDCGETKKLIACDNVTLYPEFTAEEGCSFDAGVLQEGRMQPQMKNNERMSAIEIEKVIESDSLMEENYDKNSRKNELENEIKKDFQLSYTFPSTSKELVEVFPNPSEGSFQIRLNSSPRQYQCIQVVDSKGVVICSINHPSSQVFNVTVGNRTGIFFVKCVTNSYTEIKKVIVK